jgi:hypothetical protein
MFERRNVPLGLLLVGVGASLLWRFGPFQTTPARRPGNVSIVVPAAPAAPAPATPEAAVPAPAALAAPAAPAPPPKLAAETPGSNAEWQRRLEREDEILVTQAVAAGVDPARAAKLRTALAERRASRETTIAQLEQGKINEEEMQLRAHAAKTRCDGFVAALLSVDEREALDPVAARAQVVREEGAR